MAPGAQRGNVLQMVLAQGVRLIVPGVLVGILAAMLVADFTRSMLFGHTLMGPGNLCGGNGHSGDCDSDGQLCACPRRNQG